MAEIHENDIDFYIFYNVPTRRNEAIATAYTGDQLILTIPELIQGYPVTKIGKDFVRDSNIEEIHFPDSVSVIKDCAFISCKNLKIVKSYPSHAPAKSLYLYDFAFNRCESLEEFYSSIPILVGSSVFRNCLALEKISAKIASIGDRAFQNTAIIELQLADGVIWATDSFMGTPKLRDLYFYGTISSDIGKSYFRYIKSKILHVTDAFNYFDLIYYGFRICHI